MIASRSLHRLDPCRVPGSCHELTTPVYWIKYLHISIDLANSFKVFFTIYSADAIMHESNPNVNTPSLFDMNLKFSLSKNYLAQEQFSNTLFRMNNGLSV